MRVLTWNLWWSFGPWRDRQAAIRTVLERENPDIILAQETMPGQDQAGSLAAHLGFHHVQSDVPDVKVTTENSSPGGRGMANAILSRWPILRSSQVLLPADDGRPKVRTVLMCVVQSPWGPWPIVTTHLDHHFDGSSLRMRQVDALADAVRELLEENGGGLPAIVGGDLNAVPDSDEIRRLTGRTAVRHPNLVFNDIWELRGAGHGYTWSSSNHYLQDANWPNRRIDYLFVTWPRVKPAGHPERVWLAGTEPIDGVTASDHFAVVADVRVPE